MFKNLLLIIKFLISFVYLTITYTYLISKFDSFANVLL